MNKRKKRSFAILAAAAGLSVFAVGCPSPGITPAVYTPFVTVWDMSRTATNTLVFPLDADGFYDFTIDWGDGIVEKISSSPAVHAYAVDGTFTVTVTGRCEGFGFASGIQGNEGNLVDVSQWGSVKFHNKGSHFRDCTGIITFSAADVPDLTGIANLSYMFSDAYYFNGDLSLWDMSGVENMKGMFSYMRDFNQDLSSWDVSSVKDMGGMFNFAESFNRDISGWKTGNVMEMSGMFNEAEDFNQDLSVWNTASVINMDFMFYNASSFTNGGNASGMENWTTAAGCSMYRMFDGSPLNPRPSWY